jgi:hypothetical protein
MYWCKWNTHTHALAYLPIFADTLKATWEFFNIERTNLFKSEKGNES